MIQRILQCGGVRPIANESFGAKPYEVEVVESGVCPGGGKDGVEVGIRECWDSRCQDLVRMRTRVGVLGGR